MRSRKLNLRSVPDQAAPVETLTGQIRGYCTGKPHKAALRHYGLAEKHIYTLGVGLENIDPCIRSFRGRPGCLVLAEDLRAFGPTKNEVAERADALEKADIRILDLSHPEDQSYAALVQRAHKAISGSRFGNKSLAKRQGRAGGRGKGTAEWNMRDEVAPKWLIDKIVNHGQIPWVVKMDLLAPYFTQATLRRHYGIKPTMGRREDVSAS